MSVAKPPLWKQPKPAGAKKSAPLSPAQRDAARARAAAAKRRYPNLVDNVWAARHVPPDGVREAGILEALEKKLSGS